MAETDDERERIREQKKNELLDDDGSDAGSSETGAATPTEPIEITGNDHLQSVVSEHDVVLVDCHAEWCGPCKMMEPTIDALASESDAAVAKVDVDQNQQLAGQLGVQGVPTLLLYVDGEPVERLVGAQDRATLDQLIQQAA